MNINYFKQWSFDVAYVLGLWLATGGRSLGHTFSLFLHSKDKYVLKLISQKLQCELKEIKEKHIVYLSFTNEEIYNDIMLLCGGNLHFSSVPVEYMPDFIRGYFDGCGKVCKVKGNRLNVIFIDKNKDLYAALQQNIGVRGGSYNPSDSSLRFGTRDSRSIGEYMYRNDPELFLLRKKRKFIFKEDTQK